MATTEALEKLAASFDARAERAFGDMGYTRSGYLTRDSVRLQGMGIVFETAARELRALLEPAATPAPAATDGGDR